MKRFSRDDVGSIAAISVGALAGIALTGLMMAEGTPPGSAHAFVHVDASWEHLDHAEWRRLERRDVRRAVRVRPNLEISAQDLLIRIPSVDMRVPGADGSAPEVMVGPESEETGWTVRVRPRVPPE